MGDRDFRLAIAVDAAGEDFVSRRPSPPASTFPVIGAWLTADMPCVAPVIRDALARRTTIVSPMTNSATGILSYRRRRRDTAAAVAVMPICPWQSMHAASTSASAGATSMSERIDCRARSW